MLEKARHCVKKLCYTVKFRNILLLEMEPSSAAVFLSISASRELDFRLETVASSIARISLEVVGVARRCLMLLDRFSFISTLLPFFLLF